MEKSRNQLGNVMENGAFTVQLAKARAGDETALAGLIAREMPVIRACAGRAVCPGLAFDDAVQEGIIGLLDAIRSYDGTKGAEFSTYAGVCVQNAVYGAARAAGRRKHAPLNQSVPYPEDAGAARASASELPGPEEQVLANEQVSQVMQEIRTRLSVRERQVLALFLDGLSYGAIAARLSISEKAVDNALQRVRAKLK